MSQLHEILAHNHSHAASEARRRAPAIPFIPNRQLYILTCVDPRVEPSDVMGLEFGDAIVARNVGGRVTQSLLDDLAWIRYLHETKTPSGSTSSSCTTPTAVQP